MYDPVVVMAAANQAAKSAEPVKYLPELKKIKYEGVTGTTEFDPFGDIQNGALTLFTYKGGKRTRIDVIRSSGGDALVGWADSAHAFNQLKNSRAGSITQV